MANPALGTKRICSGCAAKFYDLGRDPIICPTCETVYVIAKAPPPRGGRAYAPRSTYDPKAQTTSFMGTLAESDAPGVVGNVKDEDEVDAEEAEAKGAEATEEPGGVPMLEELDEK